MTRLVGIRLFALAASLFIAFTLVSTDFADARRAGSFGSFGSRGSRTFSAPPVTRTAPKQAAPLERTMTPNQAPNAAQQRGVTQNRPGLFGGFGGSLLGGLALGGLVGMLLGNGLGGMAGAFGLVLQLLLIGLLVSFAMSFFRSRNAPAGTGFAAPGFGRDPDHRESADTAGRGRFEMPSMGGGGAGRAQAMSTSEISLAQDDLDTFERRLAEVQDAYGREDHADLRRLSTPEMVSFFSEELADNAKRGVRNEVRDVRLVQADIAEAWSEGGQDYATAAFRYESVDVMRDRDSGRIVEGDDSVSETAELWTFVRPAGGEWKLSAIQEA